MTCFIFNFLDISGLHGLWDFFGIVINLQKFFQYICWKKNLCISGPQQFKSILFESQLCIEKNIDHNLCSEEANNLFVLFGFIELKLDNGWHCNVILAMSGLGTSMYVNFHGKKELFRVTHIPNGPCLLGVKEQVWNSFLKRLWFWEKSIFCHVVSLYLTHRTRCDQIVLMDYLLTVILKLSLVLSLHSIPHLQLDYDCEISFFQKHYFSSLIEISLTYTIEQV